MKKSQKERRTQKQNKQQPIEITIKRTINLNGEIPYEINSKPDDDVLYTYDCNA